MCQDGRNSAPVCCLFQFKIESKPNPSNLTLLTGFSDVAELWLRIPRAALIRLTV